MGDLTARTPKPLLPVHGTPILEHILLGLRAAGIHRVIIVIGYLGEQIEARFGNGSALGLEIRFVRQETAQGTAKALLLAAPFLPESPFVLGWGDILIEPAFYGELVREFETRPRDVLLGVNEVDDPWQGGAVYFTQDGRVTRLEEKPPRGTSTTRWNNAGIFILAPRVVEYARALPASARGEFELPQAIARMVADGCNVGALPLRGFWSDVGTPADLESANRTFHLP